MEKKTDLRVLRSREAIRSAFLKQLEQRGYDAITVQGLAEAAGINRNTFYLHYENKQALLCGLTENCLKELEEALLHLDASEPADAGDWIRTLLDRVFNCVEADFACYRALLLFGPPEFANRMKNLLARPFLKVFPDTREGHISVGITVDGILGSILFWMHSPKEETQSIREVLSRFCLTGLQWLPNPGETEKGRPHDKHGPARRGG